MMVLKMGMAFLCILNITKKTFKVEFIEIFDHKRKLFNSGPDEVL